MCSPPCCTIHLPSPHAPLCPAPPLPQSRSDMSPEDIVSLQLALVDLALRVYTDKIHYVDKVLQHTVDIFGGREIIRWAEGEGKKNSFIMLETADTKCCTL